MTDNITINDGTTTRTYNNWTGIEVVDKNTRRRVRKTDERDATPETLTMRSELAGVNQRLHIEFAKTKVDSVTGKQHTGRFYVGCSADTVHFTQAEVEAAYSEIVAYLAIAGAKTDAALGKI